MSVEVLDLQQVVKDYAEDFLDSDQKKHADLKNPIIDFDRMHVLYGETKYSKPESPPRPTAHVLFSANFANNTPQPQAYALRTERRTKSSSSVCFMKTFTYGAYVEMKLTPPNPIIEANAGFRTEVTKQKGVSQTYEQELTWTVDNSVTVPPGYQTKASLVIKEDSFDGEFEVVVLFEGKILVTYENKKNKEHITTIVDDVKKFFNNQKGFKKDDLGRPTFLVKGTCKCKFGVEQYVTLTETPIDPGEELEP